jgi:hypothetical protein
MDIAEQLKAAVAGSGLSVYAVAKGSKISEPVLHRFMHGERTLRLDTAAKLAAFFEMRLTRPKRFAKKKKVVTRQWPD